MNYPNIFKNKYINIPTLLIAKLSYYIKKKISSIKGWGQIVFFESLRLDLHQDK